MARNNKDITPEIELAIGRARDDDRTLYEGIFASKWVETGARWLMIGVGTAVLAAMMKQILV